MRSRKLRRTAIDLPTCITLNDIASVEKSIERRKAEQQEWRNREIAADEVEETTSLKDAPPSYAPLPPVAMQSSTGMTRRRTKSILARNAVVYDPPLEISSASEAHMTSDDSLSASLIQSSLSDDSLPQLSTPEHSPSNQSPILASTNSTDPVHTSSLKLQDLVLGSSSEDPTSCSPATPSPSGSTSPKFNERRHILALPKQFGQLAEWAPTPCLLDIFKKSPASSSSSYLKAEYVISEMENRLGPVVFLTPELGRWSTVGGLGVMVDELSQMLAEYGEDIVVISPYYERNGKGESGYLHRDGIYWTCNIDVVIRNQSIRVGVHEGRVKGVRLLFLHSPTYFPSAYPSNCSAWYTLTMTCLFARASLQALCSKQIVPSLIVTNDWFTALTPAYARRGFFGNSFDNTTFYHIVHNMDPMYEGRIYPNREEGCLEDIHCLPSHFLVDPSWQQTVLNPCRCVFLTTHSWGTVSPSYRWDLMHGSPLKQLMWNHKNPFAFPNGVPVAHRQQQVREKAGTLNHSQAKAVLQQRYFNRVDPTIPLFAFVGRITEQKGVHFICIAAWELAHHFLGKVQILVGGKANWDEKYSAHWARELQRIHKHMPHIFWANPTEFFTDGPLVNIGADFGLMPSLFEPGGIVQQEFFACGTPVIAFKTGGLKDTVYEYNRSSRTGNGFLFESYQPADMQLAVKRANAVFALPDEYEQLRKNAKDSVIDARIVAFCYLAEFYRLKNRHEEFGKRALSITEAAASESSPQQS